MDLEKIVETVHDQHPFADDPQFYQYAFSLAAERRRQLYARDGDNFKRVCAEEYDDLSQRLDKTQFQESTSVRNVLRTRRLANLLIDDKGEINSSALPRIISHLSNLLYSLGPNRQHDSMRQEHLLKVLLLLQNDKELARLLKSISRPTAHKHAEQIIRDTLQLPAGTSITDAHTRRAVLSAWMCTLRQNVGSCFATAPAIIVHDEQPHLFLKDIIDLLTTGRLKRTFGGIEYSVPLSSSWGAGDLKKPFYLPLGEDFEKSEIWTSPGLEAAFEAAGLLESEDPIEKRFGAIKGFIQQFLREEEHTQPVIIVTAEEILRKVLLNHAGLTEKDVQEYQNKPKGLPAGMIMSANMVIALPTSANKGRGDGVKGFLEHFSQACNALKALADNALLKAWEFTVASFAETKAQFTRWNLYSSLGLGPNDAGGIGERIFALLKQKLDETNAKVKDLQYEYEQLFHQLKMLEARMRSASSEKDAQWIRMEYQTKRNEFYTFEEMRDQVNYKARRFANLFDELVSQYDTLFPQYFQEVYDADMHDVSSGPYDDSPAGFRLLYKYGRSNTSQWTLIQTPDQFIDNLASFFTSTENEIANSEAFKGLEQDLSEIVTAIVSHVRTQEFLETAFYRMATAHKTKAIKNPLENLDKIDKKPWAYTSGGTMSTLVSCYYRLENKPAEVGKWVESPTELMTFLIDSLKQIPPKLMEEYLENSSKSMLIHSPTHAFLLKPGKEAFKETWTLDNFTYIWARDNIIAPRERFLENLWLSEEVMHELVQRLAAFVPINHRHYFLRSFNQIHGNMRPSEFRNHILQGMYRERSLKQVARSILSAEEIDSNLYSLLPMFPYEQLREKLEMLYSAVPNISPSRREELLTTFDNASQRYPMQPLISASSLQDIAKGLLCLAFGETSSDVDYHALIATAAQQLGLAMPAPLIFADTNWVKESFGFVVNPGTNKLELWRTDPLGIQGAPMSNWDEWLNGSRKDITWGIYVKPYEYTGV